jgi:hypothetical protein
MSANDTLSSTSDSDSSLHYFGNIWDAYVAYSNHCTQSYVTSLSNSDWHQILARLSRVALQLQRDVIRFVRCKKKNSYIHSILSTYRFSFFLYISVFLFLLGITYIKKTSI